MTIDQRSHLGNANTALESLPQVFNSERQRTMGRNTYIHTYIQQIFMMRHSPKAQGAYNEEQNCEENVQIYNIMKKINQSIN